MSLDSVRNKWLDGAAYGPVLSQTDIYLLGATLIVNPLLLQLSNSSHHIQFNIQTGVSSLIATSNPGDLQEVTAEHYEQPAVLPRCTVIHVITRHSPWCLTVENEQGVTVRDLLSRLFTFYDELITEPEWSSLSAHHQHLIKRAQGVGMAALHSPGGFQYMAQNPSMIRAHRRDWLLEKAFLEELHVDDEYANNRLGFKAPNVLVMELTR